MDVKIFKSKIMILKKSALAQHMEPKFFDFLPEDFYQVNKDQLMYMWHFLSDKDIAELYEIPTYKVKNRCRDFNIKPITSAIDRIERELCGREDWLEEELKSVLPFEHNNGNIPHTNSTPLNSEKEFLYMKATGIVRRMDDLGRVVIPKEIRRTMKIGEGTPLEIFIDKDGGIIFRKYSPVGEMSESAQRMSECVSALCGAGVAVSDRDRIVASAGIPKRELMDKPISRQIEELMKKRKPFISSGEDTVLAADGGLRTANAAFPILSEGDICGMFMLIKDEKSRPGEPEENLRLARLAADFLGKEAVQ